MISLASYHFLSMQDVAQQLMMELLDMQQASYHPRRSRDDDDEEDCVGRGCAFVPLNSGEGRWAQ